MRVFIVYAEVVPGKTNKSIPFNHTNAFVECYVPAMLMSEAIDNAKLDLVDEGYKIVDINKCIRYDPDEWHDGNDPKREVRNSVNKAKDTYEVVYGIFRWFTDD